MSDPMKTNVLRSFKWKDDPTVTFSVHCPDCNKWIECREPEAGECVCGRAFRIALDMEPDWSMPQGARCTDCGAEDGFELVPAKHSPWRISGSHQITCQLCVAKT